MSSLASPAENFSSSLLDENSSPSPSLSASPPPSFDGFSSCSSPVSSSFPSSGAPPGFSLVVAPSHFHPGDGQTAGNLELVEKMRFQWQSDAFLNSGESSSSSSHRGSKPASLGVVGLAGASVNFKFLGKGSVANKAKDQAEQTNHARWLEFQKSKGDSLPAPLPHSASAPVLVKLPPAYRADKFASITFIGSGASSPVVRLVFSVDSPHARQSIWLREDFVNAPHPQPLLQLAIDTPFLAECWMNEAAKELLVRSSSAELLRFSDLNFESGCASDAKARRKRKVSDQVARHLVTCKLDVKMHVNGAPSSNSSQISTPASSNSSVATVSTVPPSPRVFVKKARKTPDSTLSAPLQIPESIAEEEIQHFIDAHTRTHGKRNGSSRNLLQASSAAALEARVQQAFAGSAVPATPNEWKFQEFEFSGFEGPSNPGPLTIDTSQRENENVAAEDFPPFTIPLVSTPLANIPLDYPEAETLRAAAECTAPICVCSNCTSATVSVSASVSTAAISEEAPDTLARWHSHSQSKPEPEISQSFSFSFDPSLDDFHDSEFLDPDRDTEFGEPSRNSLLLEDDQIEDFDSTNSNSSSFSLTTRHFARLKMNNQSNEELKSPGGFAATENNTPWGPDL